MCPMMRSLAVLSRSERLCNKKDVYASIVHCFEKLGVVGEKDSKCLPNHPVGDGVAAFGPHCAATHYS